MNLRDCIVAGLGLVKEQAKAAMVSTVSLAKQADLRKLTEVNTSGGVVGAATLVVGGVVGYFLWPAAAAPAVAAGTMKAPGAAGFLISRAAFLANTQRYFQILHKVGAAAAAAAFA